MRWTTLPPSMPPWASLSAWGIGTKVVALAVASVAVTGAAMGGMSAWQSSRFADDAKTDVAALVENDISRTAAGVYGVVSSQGASTAARVDADLAVAHHVLDQAGGFQIDDSGENLVRWEAKNQLTGEVTALELPRVLAGEEWLGQNSDVAVPTPVVDTVMRGETYRGNAFVVDSWLVSAYAPLHGPAGDITGVLYVGVKQENYPPSGRA